MLSPTPFSLICALLLCLPFAVIYTIVTPLTPNLSHISRMGPMLINKTDIVPPLMTAAELVKDGQKPPLSSKVTAAEPGKDGQKPPLSSQMTVAEPGEDGEEPLLRQAAKVKPKTMRLKKIAFMFLTTTPLPFAPLWEMYFNQTPKSLYNIYIHSDPKLHANNFTGMFSNRVIPGSIPTQRYSPTLILAARKLLSHALIHDKKNYMFALLSPSCIPLHSFNFTYKTLTKSKKSFVEILRNEPGAWDRWAARGEHAMLPEVPFEDFRIGSQFFTMTRKHARVVVNDTRLWGKFKLPCVNKYTCYPEEHYFATLMNMVDPRGCVHATLTHVDWNGRHDGHPRMYLKEEVGKDLIFGLRNERPRYGDEGETRINGSDSSVRKSQRHPFLFARKFSPESVQPLMDIASSVIFKD